MHRYFFDITDIIRYVRTETSISGIQRVSLEIIKRMLERYGPDRVLLSYWDARAGCYFVRDAEFLAQMQGFDFEELSAVLFPGKSRPLHSIAPILVRYRNQPLKYRFHHTVATLQALRGNTRYFRSRGSSIEEWKAYRKTASLSSKSSSVATSELRENRYQDKKDIETMITSGDRIIMLGAGWGIKGLDECFTRLSRNKGARVFLMVHDLIPLVAPEHIHNNRPLEFYRWLEESAGYCDRYLANSEHTARDLRAFMKETGIERPIDVIPLAQQAVQPPSKMASVENGRRAQAQRINTLDDEVLSLTNAPYVLVVGTMESRKNLWRLTQAWARLTEDRDLEVPRLVLAGKRNSHNADFNTWMETSGNLGGWVRFADKPSDEALSYLYENCLFTAMVSLYEGWGLPIGESLAFGKTAVVADNSSMPEVGGDLVEYCDAGSIDSIYSACRKLIVNPNHRRALEARIASTRLRTWDNVVADLLGKLEPKAPQLSFDQNVS